MPCLHSAYLAPKVVGQPPIRVQHRQIRAADITYTKLLMPRGTRRVRQLLQLSLFNLSVSCPPMRVTTHLLFRLFALERLNRRHFTHRLFYTALFTCVKKNLSVSSYSHPSMQRTQGLDLLRPTLNCQLNLCNFPHQVGRFRILLRRLFKSPMCSPDSPVTFIHERKDVRFVFHLKSCKNGVIRIRLACL